MSNTSTWTTIWPVITFVGGIVATQVLEWTKGIHETRGERTARKHAVEDGRHQYELSILTDAHATLRTLFTKIGLQQTEAAEAEPYDPDAARMELQLELADLVVKVRSLAVVVFDEDLRTKLDSLALQAVRLISSPDEQTALGRHRAYRDWHQQCVEAVGERIRATYAELAKSAAK